MPTIAAQDGTQLYYKDWGSGPPIVLIHGWPLDADMWEFQAPALAEAGYRVIAYDRRGFGRSEQPWTGYDYDTLADDLKTVMTGLGLEDAALVGFSMGGGEVARYMSRHGGAGVTKAVLVSSVTPMLVKTANNPDGVDRSVFDDIVAQLKKDRPKFLAEFSKPLFGVGFLSSPVSPEIIQWIGSLAMLASPHATVACVRAFSETDFRPDLARFAVPTLVIHGDADRTVPIDLSGRATAKAIPGATLKVYAGAPHGTPLTNSAELTTDILTFLGR